MIGVIADPAEADVVREFFELFKTPWEFYRSDRQYDILLCAGDEQIHEGAKLVLCYAGKRTSLDEQQKTQAGRCLAGGSVLLYQRDRLPIYGDTTTFPGERYPLLTLEGSQECVGCLYERKDRTLVRIGYDLFSEIRTLLTVGQPAANASLPALELHIALLRDFVTGAGISLTEIPPVPDGYRFIVCLTHDVDHPAIRDHKWDHTLFGFLSRAILGSFRKLIRGQISIRDVLSNWAACLKLPFVHLGMAKDFWREFDDRYLELEKGLHSTFFVIPFSGKPGHTESGPAPAIRATAYGAQDISEAIRKLATAGCEVGLHGIDAWLETSKGRQELDEIRRLTGVSEIGARMHWLYYNEQSPCALESAGAAYDSTIGYNETVGYRAGTTQVYKPLGVTRLLELPLHAMDTALFRPCYLDLSPRQATALVGSMSDNAARFGGVLTLNWHDRSLAPERLWGEVYRDLIRDLKSRGAWFATAGEATSWFRKRRAAEFETNSIEPSGVRANVAVDPDNKVPGLRLRIHKARKADAVGTHRSEDCFEMAVEETVETGVAFEAGR